MQFKQQNVALKWRCHVRHGGFVLWRIERSETSLFISVDGSVLMIRDSSLRSE
jgi:hypothetical protein